MVKKGFLFIVWLHYTYQIAFSSYKQVMFFFGAYSTREITDISKAKPAMIMPYGDTVAITIRRA